MSSLNQHRRSRPAIAADASPRCPSGLRRRGITSVMAMLYMVLFSTLAVGFYAAVSSSVQVAANEQRSTMALMAAESGMEFIKLQLGTLGVPPQTPQEALWDQVYARLSSKLDNTANMPAGSKLVGVSNDGLSLLIPDDQTQWIALDTTGRSRFRAVVTKKGTGDRLEVTVWGAHGNVTAGTRGVRLDYDNAPNEAKIFDYGVATPGKVYMNGNTKILGAGGQASMGSVMSSYLGDPHPLTMDEGAIMSGKAFLSNPNPNLSSISSEASINGSMPGDPGFADSIETGVTPPEYPTIDTSAFKPYATAPYHSSMGNTLTNVYLPPGSYNFNNAVINGVLYIYQPATVRFSGDSTINGVIVVDNEKVGTPISNEITFRHVQVNAYPSDSPQGLKDLGGAFLLADNFTADFAGNFNTVAGSIVASQVSFSGTAGGTIKGTIISLSEQQVDIKGTTTITIESQGAQNRPSGLFFGSHYEPLPDSFKEVRP